MSARNRELLTLLLAGLVASTAFASAWIARRGADRPGLAAVRGAPRAGSSSRPPRRARDRPRGRPDAAAARGAPLRDRPGLRLPHRRPRTGSGSSSGSAVGVLAFALVLVWLRYDYRVLERYKYVFGVSAIVLLMLPSVPGLGQRINGVKLWVNIGPLQFQPGEIAKIFLVIFLAGYLRDKREALARGRLKDFGPAARDLGRRDARPRPDERPRLGAPQLRDLPRDALRRHRASCRTCSRASSCSRAAPRRSTTRSTACSSASRSGSSRGPTRRSTARSTGRSSTARTATRTSS